MSGKDPKDSSKRQKIKHQQAHSQGDDDGSRDEVEDSLSPSAADASSEQQSLDASSTQKGQASLASGSQKQQSCHCECPPPTLKADESAGDMQLDVGLVAGAVVLIAWWTIRKIRKSAETKLENVTKSAKAELKQMMDVTHRSLLSSITSARPNQQPRDAGHRHDSTPEVAPQRQAQSSPPTLDPVSHEVTQYFELLNRRSELQSALEISQVWGQEIPQRARALLVINVINEARIKRMHDQLTHRYTQASRERAATPVGYQADDEAWSFFLWALEVYNLSRPSARAIGLSSTSAGDFFDRQQMQSTQDARGGKVKRVLLPGIPALSLKTLVEL